MTIKITVWFSIILSLHQSMSCEKLDMIPSRRLGSDEYNVTRESILAEHLKRGLGYDEVLNENEKKLNRILMKYKDAELQKGFQNPLEFIPSRHFFETHEKIKESPLFQLIQKMPKGAILHAHDTAMASSDYVLSLTYWENLWQCGEITDQPSFKFSAQKPDPVGDCEWKLVADERSKMGKEEYDKETRKLFTLFVDNPHEKYTDINTVWSTFMKIFMTFGSIVTYVPVWKDYYYNCLKEAYEDGVQILEFRGVLPELYDLEGKKYGPVEVADIYYEVLQKFKADHPDFIDSKLIYAPVRIVDDPTFDGYFPILQELLAKYPDFVVGFDLVAQEDVGRPLTDFTERILKFPDGINFYFHAGETNWNGMSTDENLIDAILLGAKRIGHGYALTKYPTLLQLVKQRDICIEVNPISNQVLKLVEDFRNHPTTVLFSDDYPMVISSDGPSFWEATPLSHDFYIAFLGLASARQDLRTLKKLVLNSIKYSSLSAKEKTVAHDKWLVKWNQFIDNFLEEHEGQ